MRDPESAPETWRRLSALYLVVQGTSPQSYCVILTVYWKANLASYPDFALIYERLGQAAQE